jgi:ligand-binding SRPBCC domain-containing protein
MAIHSIITVQKIPVPLDEAWKFFASPANLDAITPGDVGFKIISKFNGEKMFAGQIIEYKVRPLFNIALYWMTEITEATEGKYFIDEQKKGPYSLWRHQHHFKQIEGGVEMTDIVEYKNPFGFIGEIANSLFVRKKLRNIFEYRFKKIEEVLGKWKGQVAVIEIN